MPKNTSANVSNNLSNKIGYLTWSVSRNSAKLAHEPLIDALDKLGHLELAAHLPRVPGPIKAIMRAIPKIRMKDREWVDLGFDKEGDKIILLCKIDQNADARDYEARKLAAISVNHTAEFSYVMADSALPSDESYVTQLRDEYEARLEKMGSQELWQVVNSIARSTGGYLHVYAGQIFIKDAAYEKVKIFDDALKMVDSSYRMRFLPFRGEDASIISDDITLSFLNEFLKLRELWSARKEKNKESERKMRRDGLDSMLKDLESLRERYDFMRDMFSSYVEEFEKTIDEIHQEVYDMYVDQQK